MITVSFENRGKSGLCDCLYEKIKVQILDGTLKNGEKLPSKRSLAQNLGISVITVQNAYARLISEGYIYSVEKKGFFVSELIYSKQTSVSENESVNGLKMNAAEETENKYYADFSSNAVGLEKFPFSQWSHVMRSVLNSGDEKLLSRGSLFGCYELRSAVASYLREFRAMSVVPEQIVIGSGTENLYSMLVQLLSGRQKKVFAVENPGYKKIASVIELNGGLCKRIPLDSDGLSIKHLEKSGASVVHVSPSHHFPLGTVMPARRRQELLEWAYSNHSYGIEPLRYIIEDDYDSEFRFNGKPLPTLQSQDKAGAVIYVNTFSKTLSPSFRTGYMVLPPELVVLFKKTFKSYTCPVSSFEQYTLARFINQGFYGKHIMRMKNYYRSLRNELIYSLETSRLSSFTQIHEEDSGLHFLLTVTDPNISASHISETLKRYSVNLPLLSDFFYGRVPVQYKNTFVVNYSGIKKDCIKKSVRLIERSFLE